MFEEIINEIEKFNRGLFKNKREKRENIQLRLQ